LLKNPSFLGSTDQRSGYYDGPHAADDREPEAMFKSTRMVKRRELAHGDPERLTTQQLQQANTNAAAANKNLASAQARSAEQISTLQKENAVLQQQVTDLRGKK
jgi:hypothetical protein